MGDDAGEPVLDRLTVPSLPASIASVRRFAVAACRANGHEELADAVALLVSEVATNALVHAEGDVQVRAVSRGRRPAGRGRRREPEAARPRAAGPLEEGGRGLALVESLAAAWGVVPSEHGKVVWFELGSPDPAGRAGREFTCAEPARNPGRAPSSAWTLSWPPAAAPPGAVDPRGPLLHVVPGTDRTRSALCGARVGGRTLPWPASAGAGDCPECAALVAPGAA